MPPTCMTFKYVVSVHGNLRQPLIYTNIYIFFIIFFVLAYVIFAVMNTYFQMITYNLYDKLNQIPEAFWKNSTYQMKLINNETRCPNLIFYSAIVDLYQT